MLLCKRIFYCDNQLYGQKLFFFLNGLRVGRFIYELW